MARTRPIIGIIDDDVVFTEVLGMLLDLEGYGSVACPRGDEALAFLAREQPDAVLVDIWMEQGTAGMGIVQQLRQAPMTQDLPVIVCSADTWFLFRNARQLLQYRCAVLRKPFATEDLLAQLAALLCSRPPLAGVAASSAIEPQRPQQALVP